MFGGRRKESETFHFSVDADKEADLMSFIERECRALSLTVITLNGYFEANRRHVRITGVHAYEYSHTGRYYSFNNQNFHPKIHTVYDKMFLKFSVALTRAKILSCELLCATVYL